MNVESYRSDAAMIPWTVDARPELIVGQIPVCDAIHLLLESTVLLRGRGVFFDQTLVRSLSTDDWGALESEARAVGSCLSGKPNTALSDHDVLRALSKIYHLWNPDDAIGSESRQAIAKALDVLGLGAGLPADEVFPILKTGTRASSGRFSGVAELGV
jgi:hypothetical protein